MIRKTFYLTEEQQTFLLNLKGITVSEHIRRAIADYIEKQKNLIATTSLSKGGENGK